MVKVSIREAIKDDIPGIIELAAESRLSVWSFADYRKAIVDRNSVLYIAEVDFTFAGFILARLITNEQLAADSTSLEKPVTAYTAVPSFYDVEIMNIAVCRKYRRISVGKSLVAKLVDSIPDNAVTTLFLEVRSANKAARSFYRDFGFVETGARADYYSKPVDSAVLMEFEPFR